MKKNKLIQLAIILFLLCSKTFTVNAQSLDQAASPTLLPSGGFASSYDLGQSFTAGIYGTLHSIQFQTHSTQTAVTGLTFYLYAGNTVSGTPIYSKSISSIPAGNVIVTVTIDTPITSTVGSIYTWRLIDDGQTTADTIKIIASTDVGYSGGSLWRVGYNSSSVDLWFRSIVNVLTPPPTAAANQPFCGATTFASLQATGTDIKWYASPTGGTAIPSTTALTNGIYYASQTLNSLVSVSRTPVTVVINTTPTAVPTGTSTQSLAIASTIANLIANGTNIKWYAAASGGTPFASNVNLVNGTTYYASQTVNACESVSRFAVLANVAIPTASSLSFDGTNDSVALPTSIANALSGGTEMTIEYWFKGTNVQSAVRMQSGSSYIVAGWGASNPQFIISSDGGTSGVSCGSGAKINDSNWHHLAFVWKKNTTFTVYLDGVIQGSRVAANLNLPVFTNAITFLGQSDVNAEFLKGNLDEVRIWNRALPACEIYANRNCELPANQTNLLAYYRFNDGNANVTNTISSLTDSSGNDRNGTLTNFSLSGTTSNWAATAGVVTGTTCTTFTGITAPTADATQSFIFGSTVSNIVVTGSNVRWYAAASGGLALPSTTELVHGTSYFATQTINGCESLSRVAVLANVADPLPGTSLNFDGANDAISLPVFNFGSDQLTIEAWVKPINFASTYSEIARQGAGLPDYLLAFQNNGTTLTFGVRTGTTYDDLQVTITPASFLDGNWHHVAAVYDGATRKIYIDGVLRGSNTKTGNITAIETVNTIGNISINGAEPFNGNIDEVRFWNRALSGCEIFSNRNCELPANHTNLLAYYKFNEGKGYAANPGILNLVDSSGNNRNGSLTNFNLKGTTSNWTLLAGVATGTSCSAFTGSTTPAPTVASANQVFCTATVADLIANGSQIKWYATETGITELSPTTTLASGNYFASQTINGCESLNRKVVMVTISAPIAPAATATQLVSSNSTLANLTATSLVGATVNWYATATAGTSLPLTTVLTNNTTYYASQTITGCEGVLRTAVKVNLLFTGSSLNFDGVDDYAFIPRNSCKTDGFTVEAWVKPTNFTNPTAIIVFQDRKNVESFTRAYGHDPNYSFAFTNYGTKLSFNIKTGIYDYYGRGVLANELAVTINPSSFLDGNWHHVAAVYDGSSRKIFIDGVLAGTDARIGAFYDNGFADVTQIGNSYFQNSGFNGSIDEVRFWDRPLSACEINNNKNCELATEQNGLKGYYKFNDGNSNSANTSYNTLYSAIGDQTRHGVLYNFALTGTKSNWTNAAGVTKGSTCGVFTPTAAPTATAKQTFCPVSNVLNLMANGTAIKWYNAATGGTEISGEIRLIVGKYFASQTINECESATRTEVEVAFFAPTATPTAIASQIFVSGSTLESLPVNGENILWYAAATAGSPLAKTSLVIGGTMYYASQTVNGCESIGRVAITATQIGQAIQSLPINATLADIVITVPAGYQAYWFRTITSTPSLPLTTVLETGTYYVLIAPIGSNVKLSSIAPQSNRVAVNVVVGGTLGLEIVASELDIQLFPNPSIGIFNFNLSKDAKIEVYNTFGKVILAKKLVKGSNAIDLTQEASGIYFLKTVDGNNVSNFKLIKK